MRYKKAHEQTVNKEITKPDTAQRSCAYAKSQAREDLGLGRAPSSPWDTLKLDPDLRRFTGNRFFPWSDLAWRIEKELLLCIFADKAWPVPPQPQCLCCKIAERTLSLERRQGLPLAWVWAPPF